MVIWLFWYGLFLYNNEKVTIYLVGICYQYFLTFKLWVKFERAWECLGLSSLVSTYHIRYDFDIQYFKHTLHNYELLKSLLCLGSIMGWFSYYTGKLDKSVSRLFNFGLRRPKPFNTFFQYYYLKSLDKSVLSISRSTMHDRLIEFPCVYAILLLLLLLPYFNLFICSKYRTILLT